MEENGTQIQDPTGDTGAGGGEAKWYDSFADATLKENEVLKGYDSPESLAKAHIELQAKSAIKPDIPEAAEGYGLPATFEGMPDDLTKELSSQVASAAYAAGITKEQAGKAFAALMASEKQTLADAAEQAKKDQAATVEGLKKDLGDKWQERLTNGNLRFNQIAEKAGIPADAAKAFLDESGIGDNPTFIRFAIALADLISPDVFEQSGSGGASERSAADVLYDKK